MAKRRASPFRDWLKFYQTGLMAGEMAASSAEVIQHRSKMIADAMAGKAPLMQAEFINMWHEKITASIAATASLQKGVSRRRKHPSSLPDMMMSSIHMWASLMKPYHAKATSNARRLRRPL